MIQLALLRHGHTPWNRAGRIQGRTNIPLDDEARDHLAALRLPEAFADFDVVSSPLARAYDTAQIVTDKVPTKIPALLEMDWGNWEGAHGADLKANPSTGYKDIEAWSWSYTPPRGETLSDLRDRVMGWVETLERDTLAVCHIGVMRVILAVAHRWDFTGPPPFAVKRDRLFLIEIEAGQLAARPEPVRLVRRS